LEGKRKQKGQQSKQKPNVASVLNNLLRGFFFQIGDAD